MSSSAIEPTAPPIDLLGQRPPAGDDAAGFVRLRFGEYTFDPRTGELRRGAEPVKVPPQPARALQYLLEHSDRLVTRDELRGVLWSDGRTVDFEQGLNYCIRQLREILHDDAEDPHYIATLPRRGYRFLAPIAPAAAPARRRRLTLPIAAALAGGLVAVLGIARWLPPGGGAGGLAVAVAPFATPADNAEDRLASHVLREELLVELSRAAPEVAVLAPGSGSAPTAAFELEGSVYHVDGELTLALRLVRTADRATAWGRTFREPPGSDAWRAWPAEAAAELARALAPEATLSESG
jgi:DNA-binding winged helix-turn-helix (wHTH) protein/TolB-like protein